MNFRDRTVKGKKRGGKRRLGKRDMGVIAVPGDWKYM